MTDANEPAAIVRYRVPAPGSAWIEDEHSQMSLVVRGPDGVDLPMQREKRIRRRVEVFGASPRIVTRARIEYLEHTVTERRATGERSRPSPIAGKRYVLDASGDAVAITADGGGPISAEEEAAVRAEEKRFGKPETLAMVVARLRYTAGEPVLVPPATAARLFPGDLEVTAMELTFVERSDRAGDAAGSARGEPAASGATFALRLSMNGRAGGAETRTDVVGTLRVDAETGQPLEMKVVGPVHLTGAVSADGTLELVATRAPDPGWGN